MFRAGDRRRTSPLHFTRKSSNISEARNGKVPTVAKINAPKVFDFNCHLLREEKGNSKKSQSFVLPIEKLIEKLLNLARCSVTNLL